MFAAALRPPFAPGASLWRWVGQVPTTTAETACCALDPVSVALAALLNVSALTALIEGITITVSAQPPQGLALPYVWFEVREREQRGFGTGGLPEVELRTHVFSAASGPYEAHRIVKKVIQLLKDQSLGDVSGYTQAGHIFYDETVPLRDELVGGLRVHEHVSLFRIYVEETVAAA